jgi:hypothetical protein
MRTSRVTVPDHCPGGEDDKGNSQEEKEGKQRRGL